MDIEKKAVELKEGGTPYCLVTVVKAEGSAPRGAGSKMIVTHAGSFGTVGGGGVEHEAIEEARRRLRHGATGVKRYDLAPSGGIQVCGGAVEIFFEPVMPLKALVLFGAGHVGAALVPILAEIGFGVTVVDERADRIALPEFGRASMRVNLLPSQFLPEMEFFNGLHIVSMTHSHLHDEEIVRFCMGKPFAYLGLISSRKKWALMKEKFLAEGVSESELARVSTPIGLDIGAETPAEIAVAVAAELIQLHARPDDFAKKVGRFR